LVKCCGGDISGPVSRGRGGGHNDGDMRSYVSAAKNPISENFKLIFF